MVVLIDERPEEVTDFRRTVPAEIYASSNDEEVKSHLRIAELAIERAKRLVESKKTSYSARLHHALFPGLTMRHPAKVEEP